MVIAQRITLKVKPGRMDEFIKLLKAENERIGRTDRIYLILFGARDTAAIEFEFETMEDQHKFWHDWNGQPEAAGFIKKANELIVSGGTTEIWHLV